jgi:hypothetical protein
MYLCKSDFLRYQSVGTCVQANTIDLIGRFGIGDDMVCIFLEHV